MTFSQLSVGARVAFRHAEHAAQQGDGVLCSLSLDQPEAHSRRSVSQRGIDARVLQDRVRAPGLSVLPAEPGQLLLHIGRQNARGARRRVRLRPPDPMAQGLLVHAQATVAQVWPLR